MKRDVKRIQQLDLSVANQIAAGEVIERPASIVKELLENSLDAQADQISIEIGYGGLNQIKVSDNGVGIVADDLLLAIAPHATSKMSQLHDLYSITSMGFRGEALASIASVSRLSIHSKTLEQAHAMKLSIEGSVNRLIPCARNIGTTVEVRDVFYNAPVRKKFLKTERSEFQFIEMVVKRFALSAPHITIQLTHNGKLQLDLPGAFCDQTRRVRIRKLFGKAFVEGATELNVEHAGLYLQGWVGAADYQRSQMDQQWIYVNKRMVKDKLLNHAIKQAYEAWLYPGRHPACLLYLMINPAEVDVNVHPTKHELRFQQPRFVHDFITSQIQKALQSTQSTLYEDHAAFAVKTVQDRQVRETYVPNPLSVIPYSEVNANGIDNHSERERKEVTWIVLNNTFILGFLYDSPYLIHVVRLQQHWLRSFLQEQPLPLARRSILVPLRYVRKGVNRDTMLLHQPLLNQVGIDLNLDNENEVVIRSLPLHVPQLDINQFLDTVLSQSSPTILQGLELLTACQKFDLQQVTEEEKRVLLTYLQSLHQQADTLKSVCVRLSEMACNQCLTFSFV